jgi:zinc transporter ZupT
LMLSIIWGLVSAVSLPIGAVVGVTEWTRPSQAVIAALMSFGGGALLYALAIELFGSTVASKDHFTDSEYNTVGCSRTILRQHEQ